MKLAGFAGFDTEVLNALKRERGKQRGENGMQGGFTVRAAIQSVQDRAEDKIGEAGMIAGCHDAGLLGDEDAHKNDEGGQKSGQAKGGKGFNELGKFHD